jgi:hypothetical protein
VGTIRIAIVGSREFGDLSRVSNFVKLLHQQYKGNLEIVSGGAKGVDTAAVEAALELGIPCKEFKPDPSKPFVTAALARNTQIVEYADLVYAFWIVKKGSSGTIDTMHKALMAEKLAGIYTPKGAFENIRVDVDSFVKKALHRT